MKYIYICVEYLYLIIIEWENYWNSYYTFYYFINSSSRTFFFKNKYRKIYIFQFGNMKEFSFEKRNFRDDTRATMKF